MTPTTIPPGTPRRLLETRLATEFASPDLAASVVDQLSDDAISRIEAFADHELERSPRLDYRPTTVPAHAVGSLWVFAFGYRFTTDAIEQGLDLGPGVPPPGALEPGPVNEALATLTAAFVADFPVPVVAQWEVATLLERLGVSGVISVEPDIAADGSVTYLSTAGVAAKGLQLAIEAGVHVGHAGVLGFADHAVRCLMTARATGLRADVPAGLALPHTYDLASGQPWTRSREVWIPVDLLARTALG